MFIINKMDTKFQARKAIFQNACTEITDKDFVDSGETPDFVALLSRDNSGKELTHKIIDAGEEDLLVSPVKTEYLQHRYGVEWPTLEFEATFEDGVPTEYFCCNNPNLVEKPSTELPFPVEGNPYLTEQQANSIITMEKLELNNAVTLASEFFDEKVLNNFALGSKLGLLCNDVGSGKTRIAVAMALRDRYSQKPGGFVGNILPISLYREVFPEASSSSSSASTVTFKQFFGANELQFNAISSTNVNTLGNTLEKGYRYKCLDATLMVVSTSTFHQWKNEILLFPLEKTPSALFVNPTKLDPNDDDATFSAHHATVNETLATLEKNEHKIVLMTNDWFNDHLANAGKFFSFNRIFFDEPDTIHYISKHKITARFTWLISTTVREWIHKRYLDIKGTQELAGRDVASKIGETEFCIYDDPTIVEIFINNFTVRDESTPVDNAGKLKFIKYKPFADNFYKTLDPLLDDYPRLREALSAYDSSLLEEILGKDSFPVMDKIFNFLSNKYTHRSELNTLNLRFKEQTEFAKTTENENFNLDSESYRALKAEYLETKAAMQKSCEDKDETLAKFNDLRASANSMCSSCKLPVLPGEGFVFDCCYGVTHSGSCLEEVKVVTKPIPIRRKKAILVVEEEQKSTSLASPVEEDTKILGSTLATTSLFKNILHASGKSVAPSGKVNSDVIEKGNQVSTSGLFDINRTVDAIKYENVKDVYSDDALKKRDCKHCGMVASAIFVNSGCSTFAKSVKAVNVFITETTRQEKIKDLVELSGSFQKFLIYATNGSNVTKSLPPGSFKIIAGSSQERERALVEFRQGKIQTLVLLNHENAAGLNLTETTDLIIFNQTSEIITEQVIGRVDRLGLDHVVNIHLFDTNENMNGFIMEKYGK